MTETSYFHRGAVAGDANQAPYNAELFAKVYSLVHSTEGGYVVPYDTTYLNRLEPTIIHPAAYAVRILTGAAVVGGITYTTDANVDVTLYRNTAVNPRVDRVIIRVDWEAHTARIVLKTGRPAINPNPPELVQDIGTLYEVSLARLYLPANYNPATTSPDLIDEREFINSAWHDNYYPPENFCPDSEFMSDLGTGATSVYPQMVPAMWEFTGSPTGTMAAVDKTATNKMDRGKLWSVTLPTAVNDYIKLNWRVVNSPSLFGLVYIPLTIKILIKVIAGSVNITDSGSVISTNVYPTSDIEEVIIRERLLAGHASPILIFRGNVANTQFILGQITLSYGYIGAPFGTRHETVIFGTSVFGNGYTAKSTSTLQTTLGVSKGTQAVLAYLSVADTGSAGTNTAWASIQSNKGAADQLRVEVGRAPNSTPRQNFGIIGIDPPSYATYGVVADEVTVNIVASGVGTLDAQIYKTGIIT